jgi:predicted enzyme related to lactoylglutathione lyase
MFQNSHHRDKQIEPNTTTTTERGAQFYDDVFKNLFEDVASMLVKDKLTRFFKSVGNRITVLNDLEVYLQKLFAF